MEECNTPPCVFSTFFKLYKWYQIAQRIIYGLKKCNWKIQQFHEIQFCSDYRTWVEQVLRWRSQETNSNDQYLSAGPFYEKRRYIHRQFAKFRFVPLIFYRLFRSNDCRVNFSECFFRLLCFTQKIISCMNPLTTIIPHHIPVKRFAMQINWLVSTWWETLVVNGLKYRSLKWIHKYGNFMEKLECVFFSISSYFLHRPKACSWK